ncbi:hypothetical protein KC335_g64 [Hortaea werneckii]|nr:hypothetical protein KC335_g64 [Hortaea werneckii]
MRARHRKLSARRINCLRLVCVSFKHGACRCVVADLFIIRALAINKRRPPTRRRQLYSVSNRFPLRAVLHARHVTLGSGVPGLLQRHYKDDLAGTLHMLERSSMEVLPTYQSVELTIAVAHSEAQP